MSNNTLVRLYDYVIDNKPGRNFVMTLAVPMGGEGVLTIGDW